MPAKAYFAITAIIILSVLCQTASAKTPPEIPAQDYTIWGQVHFKDSSSSYDSILTSKDKGYTVSLKFDNGALVSYVMGSNPSNGDYYALKVPFGKVNSGHQFIKPRDQAFIHVNNTIVDEAYLEPSQQVITLPISIGNPTETIRIDLVLFADKTPPYVTNQTPEPGSTAGRNTSIYLEIKDDGAGVDPTTIVMSVEGNNVTSSTNPITNGYSLTYQPSTPFINNQQVDVAIYAVDLSPLKNKISPLHTYQFTVKNELPKADNLVISPSIPLTEDELICSYNFTDADGDTESGTEIKWYKDDVYQKYYKNKMKVSPGSTKKGQTWYFTIKPKDGADYGEVQTSPKVTIGNTPPSASNVNIKPTSPTSGDILTCDYDYKDPDDDLEEGTEIIWYVNGKTRTNLNNIITLSPTETKKGEDWYFTVKPKDVIDYGEIQTSPTVKIGNNPPVASNAKIEPSSTLSGEELTCRYDYYDADGDEESGTTIRWYKNDSMQSKYNDLKKIPEGVTSNENTWHFVVRVGDGTEQGKYLKSEVAIIGNGLPVASDLVIELTAEGDLVAKYTYTDREPEECTELRWYKAGVVQNQYNEKDTIPSSGTNKGEVWHFTVKPRDGVDYGEMQTSSSLTIGNTPPIVSNLAISPINPLTIDELVYSYDYKDADGDSEKGTEIKWYKGGVIQERYNDQKIIPSSETNKGEEWHFTVRPKDGIDYGEIKTSQKVKIGNSPPEAKELIIAPSTPVTGDDLICSYAYSDIDGDKESGTEIKWYKDDVYQSSYKNKQKVSSSSTRKGQVWYFTVKPKDATDFGEIQKSTSITIGNTPPIVSDLLIKPSDALTTNNLTCNYDYSDVDDDPEAGTELMWYRNGAIQEQYNDNEVIPLSEIKKGEEWRFTVKPKDGTDYGEMQTSPTVKIGNSPPVASNAKIEPSSPLSGEELTCSYDYYDADGDEENGTTIRWYKNNNIQSSYNDNRIIPKGVTSSGDIWHFTVRVGDGTEQGKYQKSEAVIIGNGLPVASGLVIELTAKGDLVAKYVYTDRETEEGTELRWYKGGVVQDQYNEKNTIPSSEMNKDEEWYFTVRPKDGIDYGEMQTSPSLTIGNNPPVADNPVISPSSPLTTDELVCSYDYSDSDGDTEEGTEIKWYRDGAIQEQYNNQKVIPSSGIKKGEEWYFTVKPKDGVDYGEIQTSPTVKIGNNPPVASNAKIEPLSPFAGEELTCYYDYYDADGDEESGTTIRWYKNDSMQSKYNDLKAIPEEVTSNGDIWHFVVRVGDGIEQGKYQKSETVTIGNGLPVASDLVIELTAEGDFVAKYTYTDREPEEGTELRWYKAGVVQEQYNEKNMIPSSGTNKDEIWHFTVKPKDGVDYGEIQTSSSLTIGNTPPIVSNLAISPISPLTIDELVCSYDYKDADGDSEKGTEIKWYKAGVVQEQYNGKNMIPSSETNKGEEWYFTVRPKDGIDYGETKTSQKIKIGNSPPEAKELIIAPSNPVTGDDLICSYGYSDIDGDTEAGTEIKWYKDDVYQSGYKNKQKVSSGSTKKGQTWYFTVKPKDDADFGEIQKSATITIINIQPTVKSLKITPSNPLASDDLVCSYSYEDKDGDIENGTEIKWCKNGILQEKYSNKTLVSAQDIHKGEQWRFEIMPKDGSDFGNAVISPTVNIGNTPPTVENLALFPLEPKITDELSCRYEFYDIDKDAENGTQIRWYMNGKLQTQFNDNVKIPSSILKANQIWYFTVKVNDGTQFSELKKSESVTIRDTIPIILPNNLPKVTDVKILPESPLGTDSLTASYDYTDIDGDPEKNTEIKWYRNGEYLKIYDKKIIPTNETSKGQEWYFTVKPNDGRDFGVEYISLSKTIGNIPPTVSGLYISPEYPKRTNNLICNYVFNDPDIDTEGNTEIRWYKNDILQESHNDSRVVPPSELEKGQRWYFSVKPKDDMDFGEIKSSSVIIIANSAPTVSNLVIILTGDNLICKYEYSDADNDIENGTEINCYKDNELQPSYNNSLIIPASQTSEGQKWYFTVRPRDGIMFGEVMASSVITVNGTPPSVGNLYIIPSAPSKNDSLTCQYDYFDLDGKANIEIMWFKNDEHQADFDNQSTIPSKAISKGEKWNFSIRIRNGVNEWQKSQSVIIRNSIPKAIISTENFITTVGTPIRFYGSDSTDVDNDKLSFRWDFGVKTMDSTEQDPIFVYTESGEYTVTLIVNDGSVDSEIATAKIKVEESLRLLSASYDIPNTSLLLRFNKQVQLKSIFTEGDISIEMGDSLKIDLILNSKISVSQKDSSTLALDISNLPDIAMSIIKSAVIQRQKAEIILHEGVFIDVYGLGNQPILGTDNFKIEMVSDGFMIGLIGDVNGNGIINKYDAEFILQAAAKGNEFLPIYDAATKISRWMAKQEYFYDVLLDIADMDRDGQISSYDASLIMRESSELVPKTNPITPATKKAVMEVRSQTNKQLDISISLSDNSGVYSADVILTYDPQMLNPKYILRGTANSQWLLTYVIPEPGKIKASMAGIFPPETDGSLLDISFDSISDIVAQMPAIASIQINAGKAKTLVENLPYSSALMQNYPNPCNPETWIPYRLTSEENVRINIYNSSGKIVRQLDLGLKMPGHYVDESKAAYWDGKNESGENASNGIYFYELRAGEYISIKKMIIVR